jgi:dihydrodipicolinate synthase/N-acetylneuraminate lyase
MTRCAAVDGAGCGAFGASNVAGRKVQLVEAAERGDFATARRWHEKPLP